MSIVEVPPTTPVRSEARTARTERLRLLLRSPSVLVGTLVLAFWVFCALFPGLVARYDPIFDNQFPTNLPPEWSFPFGTDTNGRDILS
jgi:peptide/nickel transport system permease protein